VYLVFNDMYSVYTSSHGLVV